MQESLFARLQDALVRREGLSLAYAAILAENALYRFEEETRAGAILWLEDQLSDDFAARGISIGEVILETGVKTVFQALCALDIVLKDPARTADAIWSMRRDELHA